MVRTASEAVPPTENSAADAMHERHKLEMSEFGEFFDGEDAEYDDDDDNDETIDIDDEMIDASAETAMPEELADSADWVDLYEAGIGYIEAARLVFPDEFADAEDEEINESLWEWTQDMSPEELEGFWGNIGRLAKKAFKAAAPLIQKAAPVVGTVIGAGFGGVGAPIGGMIGRLVGSCVGALSQAGARRRRRRPRRLSVSRRRRFRRMRMQRRRPMRYRRAQPRSGSYRRGGAAGWFPLGAAGQLVNVMRDPRVQQALARGARGVVSGRSRRSGDAMSNPAVLAGLYGGVLEALREMQAEQGDLDHFADGFGPADFETPEQAFATLAELVEEDAA